jgi:hypothetical protein
MNASEISSILLQTLTKFLGYLTQTPSNLKKMHFAAPKSSGKPPELQPTPLSFRPPFPKKTRNEMNLISRGANSTVGNIVRGASFDKQCKAKLVYLHHNSTPQLYLQNILASVSVCRQKLCFKFKSFHK